MFDAPGVGSHACAHAAGAGTTLHKLSAFFGPQPVAAAANKRAAYRRFMVGRTALVPHDVGNWSWKAGAAEESRGPSCAELRPLNVETLVPRGLSFTRVRAPLVHPRANAVDSHQ